MIYREEQRFRQWWIWLILVVVAGAGWWAFVQQILVGRPFGNNPAPDWAVWVIWVVFGLAFPVLFLRIELVIEVTPEQVLVRFWPFGARTLSLADIEKVEARRYNAVAEYGGWGIKGWSRDKMAYNVSGNRGVELTLRDGRRILLGSQRSDELAAVISSARASR